MVRSRAIAGHGWCWWWIARELANRKYIFRGYLPGSVCTECNSWSWGCKPHVGCRASLKYFKIVFLWTSVSFCSYNSFWVKLSRHWLLVIEYNYKSRGALGGSVGWASHSWLWLKSWSQGMGLSPVSGSVLTTEPAWDSVSHLPLSPTHALSLSKKIFF